MEKKPNPVYIVNESHAVWLQCCGASALCKGKAREGSCWVAFTRESSWLSLISSHIVFCLFFSWLVSGKLLFSSRPQCNDPLAARSALASLRWTCRMAFGSWSCVILSDYHTMGWIHQRPEAEP
ncbi:unnamed protein product [Caretta caretta]